MKNPEAKQRAEAIGSLMVEYFTSYLANPCCDLTDTEAPGKALVACNELARNTLTLAEADYKREAAEHERSAPVAIN